MSIIRNLKASEWGKAGFVLWIGILAMFVGFASADSKAKAQYHQLEERMAALQSTVENQRAEKFG